MALKLYRQKRNFQKTAEPHGKAKSSLSKNVYVIQKHAASHLHYDFRLELEGSLKSWAIPKGPSLDPNVKRLAVHVEDHPVEYGSFEGSIPKGQYGGGTVMLWDKGEWVSENAKVQYQKGSLTFTLKGKKLKGLWKLIRIKSTPNQWLLIKVKDQYSRNIHQYDITQEKSKSILSKKTLAQLEKQFDNKKNKKDIKKTGKKEKMPLIISPQLATLVDKLPEGDEWLHEIKLDGYRFIAFIKNKKIKLMTRNHQDWTHRFNNVVAELKKLSVESAILDGEIVILDKNQRSDFQLLQNAIKNSKDSSFVYYVFDLIYYNGYDISSLPLIERKNRLHRIIQNTRGTLRYSDHVIGSGDEVFKKSCELLLEGIVSKNMKSAYIQRRTRHWLKIKCVKRQEFVIAGYTKPKGARSFFGSLLLGVYSKNKKLMYCGHVGTGFNSTSLKTVFEELKKYVINTMPFEKKPPNVKNVNWIKPVLVAEVEFAEWTSDGILRHPSFKGLRRDKSPKEIKREK